MRRPFVFVPVLAASLGCRSEVEPTCRRALAERDEDTAAIVRGMQAARAAGRPVAIPLSEALAAQSDAATFTARCRASRSVVARCTSRRYREAHGPECAAVRDEVNRVLLQ